MIVELKHQVKGLARDLSAVSLREYLTGGDVLAQERCKGSDTEKGFVLLARLAGLDMAELESLHVADINVLMGHVNKIVQSESAEDPKG